MSCFLKLYNSRIFACESYFKTTRVYFVIYTQNFLFKIAAPGEGRKPSHEEYVAESEFALLGIPFKKNV